MRLRLLGMVVLAPLVLWLALPLVSSGEPSQRRLDEINDRITRKRAQLERVRGRERVLAQDVAQWTQRIRSIQDDITVLERREVRLQADLERKLAELERIRERLRVERLRVERLRARLLEAKRVLADRLVELYKADEPDMVTVILEADGFADLLERSEFMQRVSQQDAAIIRAVKAAKAEAEAAEARLEALEARQRALAAAVERRRDEVVAVKGRLVERRSSFQRARADRAKALAATRESRHGLEAHLSKLEAESQRVSAALRAAAAKAAAAAGGGGATAVAGPVRPGASGLIWPVNGPLTSPFGMRWGRLHAGVDIGAPSGTPIRAAAAGRVVLLGWTGGYGNYTCIQHSGALSTCYAHQSRYATSMGASVGQGQVIGYVGNTGNSFGAHLHFETRVNGSPVNPAGYL